MPDNSQGVIELFTEASKLPIEERTGFLDRVCADEGGLRQKVEALLRSHDRVEGFLEEPATTISKGRTKVAAGEKPGDQVDRYQLLQQIGEGGCGVVFAAEQQSPVMRRVALKLIKPGMDTKSVIARFEAERQVLALMDHPNIAHVLDAGATASGHPYFVMELVRGPKITDFCDQKSLSTKRRLELFIQVCGAVQHAHQKGIIHRDLKPSNILITTDVDGNPAPKVIDFGIAKATSGQRLTDKTLFTSFDMFIGTPAYMSPEQAELTSIDVDTRSDIYSLGVLLYELLTGTTPFEMQELIKAGLDEVRRVIRTVDPTRPSVRLCKMTADELAIIAQRHSAEAAGLIRETRGDLDWIVMKAMEKDRERRYATANGLALDIKRYLSSEAILARPPSASYKFQKLVARNKLIFSGVALIFVLLVTGLIATTHGLMIERRARELMGQQLDLARADRLGWELYTQGKFTEAEQMLGKAVVLRRQLPQAEPISELQCSMFIVIFQKEKRLDKIEPFLTGSVTPDLLSRPGYQPLYEYAVDTLARAGRWNEADTLAEKLYKANPSVPLSCRTCAILLAEKKDLEGYRHICGEIISRFGNTTDPDEADQLAKACLIFPSSGPDLKAAAALADVAVTRGSNSIYILYFKFCKGLAEYRLEHYQEAANWARLAADPRLSTICAGATAIIAMCEFKLTHPEQALSALADCKKEIEEQMPTLEQGDLGDSWRDWIIARELYSEAEQMVQPGSSAATPPTNLQN